MYFVLVLAAIAVALECVEAHRVTLGHPPLRLLWLPAADWMVMLAAIIPVFQAACVIAETVVWVFEGIAACMELDNVHYVLFGITPALRFAPPLITHHHPCSDWDYAQQPACQLWRASRGSLRGGPSRE